MCRIGAVRISGLSHHGLWGSRFTSGGLRFRVGGGGGVGVQDLGFQVGGLGSIGFEI